MSEKSSDTEEWKNWSPIKGYGAFQLPDIFQFSSDEEFQLLSMGLDGNSELFGDNSTTGRREMQLSLEVPADEGLPPPDTPVRFGPG